MCLDRITKKYDENNIKGYGYVVMGGNKQGKGYKAKYSDTIYDVGCEYGAVRQPARRINVIEYFPGFHIFKTLNSAKLYQDGWIQDKIVKVKYRKVICDGTIDTNGNWDFRKVVVAKYRTILKEV
jgi:hypothetical protein